MLYKKFNETGSFVIVEQSQIDKFKSLGYKFDESPVNNIEEVEQDPVQEQVESNVEEKSKTKKSSKKVTEDKTEVKGPDIVL